MERILKTTEFSPYVIISSNINSEVLDSYIYNSERINLVDVITLEEYEAFTARLQDSYNIAGTTLGPTTQIELATDTDFTVNDWFQFKDVGGSFGNAVNGDRFKVVSVIDPKNIVIDFDSTGLSHLSQGVVFRIFSEKYEALRLKCLPYLAYDVEVAYSQSGEVKNTNTGIVQKLREQSENLTDLKRGAYINGQKNKRDVFERELIDFLEDNKTTYTLYAANKGCETKPKKNVVAIFPAYNRKFDFRENNSKLRY